MSTSHKNLARSSQYSATSRKRAAMRAQATLMGWEPLDILGAYRDGGNLIVVLRDETRIVASVVEQTPRPTPESAPVDEVAAHRQKKVYAPRSWDAERWNRVVEQLKSRDFSKDEARSEIAQGKTLDDKQKRHALAVIDAVPDVPDWYAHLPLAEES